MKVVFNSIGKELSVVMESISTLIKTASLSVPLLASLLIHGAAILAISTVISRGSDLIQNDLIPIGLIEMPRAERETPTRKEETPPETKKTPPPLRTVDKTKESKPVSKNEIVPTPRSAPPTAAVEPTKLMEAKTDVTPNPEKIPSFATNAPVEGGGSEAGAGNLFGKGDVGVVPGSGTAGEGGGTVASSSGRGSGAAGLPAPTTVLKTSREAKPTQTARAAYPPMALRMGLEGDVTLRIEVDTEGKVTKAEIIKGAGTVFDEEAIKSVKQSRFEPAQKDGRNVPAEFTYVYHFRLSK
jgi:TonB family protein